MASAIDVAPALLIPLLHKFKLVSVLLNLITSAIDVAPASLIPLSDKSRLISVHQYHYNTNSN